MSVAAYALTAYRPDERGPLQGALNFAITNSVGAFFSLSGIALIYARTGALNMAQIGRDLSGHRPDGLVVVAFVFIITGLLVKAGIVPFQFWHADAHAVAPTPVCVLFSGVMAELGLYGVARIYWSMFGSALGHRAAITTVFLVLGLLTAVVGALYCFRERHIKRLLAFSTISHAGTILVGLSLLTPLGLAGAAMYVAGHALLKAALFLCIGIVLHRLGSVNETALHGRGRALRVTGVVFTLAALGLADLPPFATFLGKGWIEDSAAGSGQAWIVAILVTSSILVGGAVLRVAGGVFYGLGDPPGEDAETAEGASEEKSETEGGKRRTPLTMIIPPAVPMLAGLTVTLVPRVGRATLAAAVRFEDQAAYNATVLQGAHVAHPAAPIPAGMAWHDAGQRADRRRLRRGRPLARGGRAVLAPSVVAAPVVAAPRVRAWRPPGACQRVLPERRRQRLRDLAGRRHRVHWRRSRFRPALISGRGIRKVCPAGAPVRREYERADAPTRNGYWTQARLFRPDGTVPGSVHPGLGGGPELLDHRGDHHVRRRGAHPAGRGDGG